MAIHHLTEYSLNGGEWLQAYADEEAGPGKTLTISGLSAGTYDVRLRITPLTGGGPAVVSESVELVIEGGASVSQSQIKQVQDIQAALSFIASGAQVAAVQVSSALGSMLFSGSVNQSQTLQSELVSGGGIILGSSSQAQKVQVNSAVSVLEYLASVASGQSVQSEAVNSVIAFLGDSVQTQSVQTESLSGEGIVTGTSAQSQAIQTANSVGLLQFLGSVVENQVAQIESGSGSTLVDIEGSVATSQTIQAEASSAALVFYGTVNESQAVQSELLNGVLSFVGNSVANQAVQTRTGSGSLGFSGNAAETQINQSESASGSSGAPAAQGTGFESGDMNGWVGEAEEAYNVIVAPTGEAVNSNADTGTWSYRITTGYGEDDNEDTIPVAWRLVKSVAFSGGDASVRVKGGSTAAIHVYVNGVLIVDSAVTSTYQTLTFAPTAGTKTVEILAFNTVVTEIAQVWIDNIVVS